MSVYIFTGPTISVTQARGELDAVYLPPAAEGDVYRAALRSPKAIGIIDGYFQSVPAVRHKEILWAMSRGIHVFGSASMGALRAAELIAFGMEGVGIVFEWYRDGVLEDDDEVAVVHGPSDTGFQLGSEAMVNIRQTLRKAELLGVISNELRIHLERIGKELFYPDRNYWLLLRRASEEGLSDTELNRLRGWLPENGVNQKQEDAVAMLRAIRERLTDGFKPKAVSYCFEHTAMWESASRQSGNLRFDTDPHSGVIRLESIVNELRLEAASYRQQRLMALLRFFVLREAERLGISVSEKQEKQAEATFRRERGLVELRELEDWIAENDLTKEEFAALMTNEARLDWVEKLFHAVSITYLPEQLRLSGALPGLIERVAAKDRLLEELGLQNPSLERANLSETQLLQWYFEDVIGCSVPHDPQRHAADLGFATPDAFRRVLLREYLYCRAKGARSDADHRLASDGA